MILKHIKTIFLFFAITFLIGCTTEETMADEQPNSETPTETNLEINIEAIKEGDILAEKILLKPSFSIPNSDIQSFEILFNNQSIAYFEDFSSIATEFDPRGYATGEGVFKFVAIDKKSEKIEKEIKVSIERLLITLNFDQDFIQDYILEHWVFASLPDGSPIDLQRVTKETRQVKLYSKQEFTSENQFMLTSIAYDNGSNFTLKTINNITQSTPGIINFGNRNGSRVVQYDVRYTRTGFSPNTYIRGVAIDHSGVEFQNELSISTFDPIWDDTVGTDYVYFVAFDRDTRTCSYEIMSKPIPNDYVLNSANFTANNIETRPVTLTNSNQPLFLRLHGFDNKVSFLNNSYHQIFFGSIGNGSTNYPLNTSFYNYRYELSAYDYTVAGIGELEATYTKPDWNLQYSYNNNTLSISKTGIEHKVGKFRLSSQTSYDPSYWWDFSFDSQSVDEISIPQIPDGLAHLDIYSFSKTNPYEFRQVELINYVGMIDYKEYLNKMVKEDKPYIKFYDEAESVQKVINNQNGLPSF